jgi:hypothetical protein
MAHPTLEADAPRIDEFVRTVLYEHGFNELPEEEQQRLLPAFTEQALVRLGTAIAPRLSAEGVQEFIDLTENEQASAEDWAGFWRQNIPDFTMVAKNALEQYVQEIETLMTV